MFKKSIFAATAFAVFSTAALASVTFDPDTGTGFVGKGDVQLALGYNNKQLQDNAAGLVFAFSSSTSNSWTCSRTNAAGNEVVTPRNNETTSSGVFSSIARSNSNGKDGSITGFNLTGFNGSTSTTTDGQPTASCPTSGGLAAPFAFDEGSLQTTNNGGGVTVNGVPLN